jgi:hypothetical protein
MKDSLKKNFKNTIKNIKLNVQSFLIKIISGKTPVALNLKVYTEGCKAKYHLYISKGIFFDNVINGKGIGKYDSCIEMTRDK